MKGVSFFICACLLFTKCQGSTASLGSFFRNYYRSRTCETSEWSAWSARPISGCSTVTRTRTITRHGNNCPSELAQSEERCGRPSAFETVSSIRTGFLNTFSVAMAGRFESASSPPTVDLLFVIDKSGSIGKDDFDRVIEHVQTLIEVFPVEIARHQTRIAAISFSSAHQVDIDFNFDACHSKDSCIDLVGQIDFEGGWTHTGKALNKARSEAFTSAHGSRSNSHKVVFLVTDGHSNGHHDVAESANALKAIGVEIYALAVTESINEDELKQIVSEPIPDHLYYYNSFSVMSHASMMLRLF